MITQARLKELVSYDCLTGEFSYGESSRFPGRTFGKVGQYGYVRGQLGKGALRKNYNIHRLAFLYVTGAMPDGEVDHINGNKADNRWANLRVVTRTENLRNCKMDKRCRAGYKGVAVRKNGKFTAILRVDGRIKSFGTFPTAREAAIVVGLERLERHGIHARFE